MNYTLITSADEAMADPYTTSELVIDLPRKTIALYHLNPVPGAEMVAERVPDGFNIFNILNLTVPSNISETQGWSVLVSPNSTKYEEVKKLISDLNNIIWHLEVPETMYMLILVLYMPVIILGALFNLVIIAIFMSSRILRKDPRNYFLVTLAISDFFLCVFTSPLSLWYILEGHWPIGGNTELLCKVVKAGQDFPIFMSSFLIVAIACDRFRFIVQFQKKQMTTKMAVLSSLLLALLSSMFVSPVFVTAHLYSYPYLANRYFCKTEWEGQSLYTYTVVTNLFHFVFALIIVCVLYAAIYWRLRSRVSSHNPEVNRRRRRTNIFLALITIIFFLAWTPMVVYSVLFSFCRDILPQRHSMAHVGYAISLVFGLMSSIANPILYTWLNESFKEAFQETCLGRWMTKKQVTLNKYRRSMRFTEVTTETGAQQEIPLRKQQKNGENGFCDKLAASATQTASPARGSTGSGSSKQSDEVRCSTPIPTSSEKRKMLKKQQQQQQQNCNNEDAKSEDGAEQQQHQEPKSMLETSF